jgi:gliding motility-associated protein GldM
MINLMYIVFLAMMALNISSDVLSGFKHVEDALDASNRGVEARNEKLYNEFEAIHEQNAEKSGLWFSRAQDVRTRSTRLVQMIDSLKLQLVRYADGEKGDVRNIKSRENLESVNYIMLSPLTHGATTLREALEEYREALLSYLPVTDGRVIAVTLSTDVPETAMGAATSWESAMFENIPLSAAVTILAKIQGDVLNAEGEALATLIKSVDSGDVRVNQLSAFVIPNSRNVMRGSQYEAQIVMAAIDTTSTPEIYIGGKLLESARGGHYSVVTAREGIQTLEGYLEVSRPDGSKQQLPFSSNYFVSEPVATVSNTMMNVMYAGIENPLSISVPGIASSQISASMTNGTLSRSGGGWVAKPSKVGQDAVISVTATQGGRSVQVSQMTFRVRRLPDPTPYILYKDASGTTQQYKGGAPISKNALLAAGGLRAAIDDGLLNVEFTVKSFRIDIFDSMGNDIPEDSQSAQFSERQLTALRRLQKGKKCFITRVKAVGPDGLERTLSPIEVIIN